MKCDISYIICSLLICSSHISGGRNKNVQRKKLRKWDKGSLLVNIAEGKKKEKKVYIGAQRKSISKWNWNCKLETKVMMRWGTRGICEDYYKLVWKEWVIGNVCFSFKLWNKSQAENLNLPKLPPDISNICRDKWKRSYDKPYFYLLSKLQKFFTAFLTVYLWRKQHQIGCPLQNESE